MFNLHRLEDKKAAEEHHTTRRVRSDCWSGRTGATVEECGARGGANRPHTHTRVFQQKIFIFDTPHRCGYIFQKWVTFPTTRLCVLGQGKMGLKINKKLLVFY